LTVYVYIPGGLSHSGRGGGPLGSTGGGPLNGGGGPFLII